MPENTNKPTQEQYQQWAQQSAELGQQIAEAKRKRDALMAQTGCKKPILMIGAKKTEYLNCLKAYQARVEAANIADREIKRMELAQRALDAKLGSGIGTGGWIAISVGVALLLTGTVILIVKMNKK